MKSILSKVAAAAMAASCAFAGELFEAKVWRGETAYVRPPDGVGEGLECLAGLDLNGVSVSLLYFEDVAFDKTEKTTEVVKDKKGNVVKDKNGKDKTRSYQKFIAKAKVPDLCREWEPGDSHKPTMVKLVASPDADPGRRIVPLGTSGNIFVLTVVDRVLPPAKDWKYFLDL